MIASFHLVTFRRRKRLPPDRSPGQEPGLRYWASFATGLDPFHSMPPNVPPGRLMRPNLREWAYFAVWETEADADRFLAGSRIAQRWSDDAAEVWSTWLRPAYARGNWAGIKALHGFEPDGPASGPLATITRLDLPARALAAMWLSAAPRIAAEMPSVPGFVVGIPILDRVTVQRMSFSLWRSVDDAMSFAYAGARHAQAVERLRLATGDIVSRFSSARFDPYRSEGTWKGIDPLRAAGLPV
jgi:hypothetical protein